jgi:cell wall-associated NlpC family hydrolase
MRFLSSSRLKIAFFVLIAITIGASFAVVGKATYAKSSGPSCSTGSTNTIVAIAETICHGHGAAINGWSGAQIVPYVSGGGHNPGSPGPDRVFGTVCQKGQKCGVDCSGFTRWVYFLAYGHKDVLNNKGDSSTTGQLLLSTLTKVPDASAQPGDLVFFAPDSKGIGHVGIYIGNGMMIHAPSSGKNITALAIQYFGRPTIGYYRYTPQLANIAGTFRLNPNNSGQFDATQPVVFTQGFQAINFNPDPSSLLCSLNTTVDGNTRPFTDIYPSALGTVCRTVIAENSSQTEQAGVNGLYTFQADFMATITVPSAGTLTSSLAADDGFIFAVGKDVAGNQPTGSASNPMNSAPAVSPLKSYQVIAANNQPAVATPYTVVTVFPAAGTYPVEIDYTECYGGQLSLVLSNQGFTV